MKLLKIITFTSLLYCLPLQVYAQELTTTAPIVIEEFSPIIGDDISVEESSIVVDIDIEPESPQPSPQTEQPSSTLQELIKQVKEAPDQDKRVLMNQLKIQLKTMNQESRAKAMMELKKSFSTDETHLHIRHQHRGQEMREVGEHGNHQPKFRHLQEGRNHNNNTPQPERGGGGSGHQGNGRK